MKFDSVHVLPLPVTANDLMPPVSVELEGPVVPTSTVVSANTGDTQAHAATIAEARWLRKRIMFRRQLNAVP